MYSYNVRIGFVYEGNTLTYLSGRFLLEDNLFNFLQLAIVPNFFLQISVVHHSGYAGHPFPAKRISYQIKHNFRRHLNKVLCMF